MARNPNVTLREGWRPSATRRMWRPCAISTPRQKPRREIADYLDGGVISAANPPKDPSESAAVHSARGMGVAWNQTPRRGPTRKASAQQDEQEEAAGGIEPPYGALQAPVYLINQPI